MHAVAADSYLRGFALTLKNGQIRNSPTAHRRPVGEAGRLNHFPKLIHSPDFSINSQQAGLL